jgi:integrase
MEPIPELVPFNTNPLTVTALTGPRVSEICGLWWEDVRLDDPEDAEIEFAFQVDRQGNRRPCKTDGSARTVPIPHGLAMLLVAHNLRSPHSGPQSPVFATRTGRPISQRNVSRALRAVMKKAVGPSGKPTFPTLYEEGKPPRGTLPSMHSFRRDGGQPDAARRGERLLVAARIQRVIRASLNSQRPEPQLKTSALLGINGRAPGRSGPALQW